MSASAGNILYDLSDGIAAITIDRADKLNALTDAMRGELLAAVRRADADDNAHVITITGAGRAFCTGGDIEYIRDLKAREDEPEFVRLLDEGRTLVQTLRNSDKPSIAVVNGPAIGGGLIIATACDLRFCSESASFGMPFIKIGLGPDWGGTYLLTRLVGAAEALAMLYTGDSVPAEEALRIGLVNRIWPDSEMPQRARQFAVRLARRPPEILARYKRAVYHSLQHSFDAAAELERQHELENFRSDELTKGISAYYTRRTQ